MQNNMRMFLISRMFAAPEHLSEIQRTFPANCGQMSAGLHQHRIQELRIQILKQITLFYA